MFIFETKFTIEPKRSLSVLKIFGPKEIDSFRFQIFFRDFKKFCFVLEICKLNQNVFVLFLSFWIKWKRFAFAKKSWNTSKSFGFVSKFLE
jgi:hypothetical protein